MTVSDGSLLEQRTALVLYGTETGNAQDVAYELDQSLQRHHFTTSVRELSTTPLSHLLQYDFVVFALSTTGQGEFPTNARKFWLSLLRKKLTSSSLSSVEYALVGLCDSSYPKFNLAARKIHKRLQQLGAQPVLDPCEADEQGEEGTEGAFLAWLTAFEQQLLVKFPLHADRSPIPPGKRLPSTWTLSVYSAQNGDLNNGLTPKPSDVAADVQTKDFHVTIRQNTRVTPLEHWQDVRFMTLQAPEPVEYMPGDAVAIRPKNSSTDVEQLIELQRWQDIADTPLEIRHISGNTATTGGFDATLTRKPSYTLRELLTEYLDINAIPRRSFFSKIAHFTEDEMQKERAIEFTDPQYLDEYFDYATRPRRSITEVLQEFHTVAIPWSEVINVFPILRPRQFSIASGGALKNGGSSLELLVAIVKYRTVIKRIREGVCTKYLASLQTGTTINVTLHSEGRLHSNSALMDRKHLLIGGGTGIAPLRSIIYEKKARYPQASSTLIFGCRNAQADNFFGDEWEKVNDENGQPLNVITAFSRDQSSKVYVQDRIREHGNHVREILQNANSMVVVCGSSGAMPKAVRQALKDVLQDKSSDDAAAEQYLLQLEKEGRYKQETW